MTDPREVRYDARGEWALKQLKKQRTKIRMAEREIEQRLRELRDHYSPVKIGDIVLGFIGREKKPKVYQVTKVEHQTNPPTLWAWREAETARGWTEQEFRLPPTHWDLAPPKIVKEYLGTGDLQRRGER